MNDPLPPLRQVIARHGLQARRSLGQNFLLDLNLTRRIARAAGPLSGRTLVEIGPGPGGLTRALLLEGAGKIVAVEKDARAIPALEEIKAVFPQRLEIVLGDALAVDWKRIVPGGAKIIANLPYNIATALLVRWLSEEPWPPWYQSMTLMFQKEVADRIIAPPGGKAYGRLSVLAQWRSTAVKLFDVDRRAFTPPPKVTSSVVQIVPAAPAVRDCRVEDLERVTAHAFGQRRKMLRSSMRSLTAESDSLLAGLGIAPTLRAEQIPVVDFCRLAVALRRLPALS